MRIDGHHPQSPGSATTTTTTALIPFTDQSQSHSSSSTAPPMTAGFSRQELVRVMLQTLHDIGYGETAAVLEHESGYQLESGSVGEFRARVLAGDWHGAEEQLGKLLLAFPDHEAVKNGGGDSLAQAQFLIRRQKFMELLDRKDTKQALYVLRNQISTLDDVPAADLHRLSSYMMCSSRESLAEKSGWSLNGDDAASDSRAQLFASLQKFIPNSSILPPRRLITLLEQAMEYQRASCLYHNTDSDTCSLYTDHACVRDDFPRINTHIFENHSDEVWYVAFSHSGDYLASASKDGTAIIWCMNTWRPVHTLYGHEEALSFLAWSPNDLLLLTCSNDNKIRLWDTKTGDCPKQFSRHIDAVTSCAWLPDNERFVSSGLDKTIYLWNIDGSLLFRWLGARVTDLAISHTGQTMVAICHEKKIRIYDLEQKTEVAIQEENNITSLCLSADSRYALVSVSVQEIHLWDLEEKRLVRKYTGQKQGRFVIRSCFGGGNQSFIVSGSEDCNVYIWHRKHGRLLEVLSGHAGTVNSVTWNPKNPNMFASASDDCTVRIWGNAASAHDAKQAASA